MSLSAGCPAGSPTSSLERRPNKNNSRLADPAPGRLAAETSLWWSTRRSDSATAQKTPDRLAIENVSAVRCAESAN